MKDFIQVHRLKTGNTVLIAISDISMVIGYKDNTSQLFLKSDPVNELSLRESINMVTKLIKEAYGQE